MGSYPSDGRSIESIWYIWRLIDDCAITSASLEEKQLPLVHAQIRIQLVHLFPIVSQGFDCACTVCLDAIMKPQIHNNIISRIELGVIWTHADFEKDTRLTTNPLTEA